MEFIDFFAGIGGFRLGMEQAGHKCVGSCEIDKWSRVTYNTIHNTKGEWSCNDITTADPFRMPNFNIACAGFPCQDNSIISPIRAGLEGARSGLFYEICRIAFVKKPEYLFLENVEGLLSVGRKLHFRNVITSLEELGYIPEWQVCNSRRLLPHNRPRVFIIGHRRDVFREPIFPILEIANILDESAISEKEQGFVNCLLTRKGGPSIDETYFCEQGYGPRRPTSRELFKLQGFLPEYADKARKAGVPVGELRRQAGNSVTVNVIHKIAKELSKAV